MPRAGRALLVLLLTAASLHAQQQLGNRVLGTLGLRAGSQPEPGLYLLERFGFYHSGELIDRNGNAIPIDLNLNVVANVAGVAWIRKLPILSAYYNAAIGVPAAHLGIQTDIVQVGIDRFGLGDLYLQPVRLGWKKPRYDVVIGYALYVPTGQVQPGGLGGIGRGFLVHEFQLGGTADLNRAKTWQISTLASFDRNGRKRNIDIKRGDTVQIQGGIGHTFSRRFEAGLAAYALWQVTDDSGADLPAVLLGARDRALGLGPEVAVTFPSIRSRFFVRWEHDVRVRARPLGQIVVAGLTILARR